LKQRKKHTPESVVSGVKPMEPKERYRLQGKLQAALTRVVEVLARIQVSDEQLNPKSFAMTAGVCDLLNSILERAAASDLANMSIEKADFAPLLISLAGDQPCRSSRPPSRLS
jgi:hypothetical protein